MSRTLVLIASLMAVAVAVWLLWPTTIADKDPAPLHHRMAALREAMRTYRLVYSNFPSGTYTEIVAKLTGDNPRQIRFLWVEEFHRNREGVYSDTWGTPFRIAVSNDTCVVSSAGADKTFGTTDDVSMDNTEPNKPAEPARAQSGARGSP